MTKPEDQILVIFGASGDLTKRKLIPALFELFIQQMLPEHFVILGVARTEFTDEQFRTNQRTTLLEAMEGKSFDEKQIDAFLQLVHYFCIDTSNSADYGKLREMIRRLQKAAHLPDNIIYYLATPPEMYEVIPECLKEARLNVSTDGWHRIIVEKPFGRDLQSAQHLNTRLKHIFKENQIYRIDHYLGKETVQNILVLRFSNGIFEPLWNRNYIDYIEISATETLGVEQRGKYYDQAGALRDMVQNHLMHLMAFIAMESPVAFDAESLHNEIVKVFRSLHKYNRHEIASYVVRAQYGEGTENGQSVQGYRNEKNVDLNSNTETFVGMKFFIDNWRWNGVPFYFYTGKRLAEKKSEIVIHFRATPHQFFAGECSGTSCNKLILRIQPDESISMKFGLKVPGAGFKVKQVSMDFNYDSLSHDYLPDAYERLLLDAMQDDSSLYIRNDALDASWEFIDPILQEWERNPACRLLHYRAGSGGPAEVADLLQKVDAADVFSDSLKNEDCPL